jgi:hypothetical protein
MDGQTDLMQLLEEFGMGTLRKYVVFAMELRPRYTRPSFDYFGRELSPLDIPNLMASLWFLCFISYDWWCPWVCLYLSLMNARVGE